MKNKIVRSKINTFNKDNKEISDKIKILNENCIRIEWVSFILRSKNNRIKGKIKDFLVELELLLL